MPDGFHLKRWTVTALGMSHDITATSRGRALAEAWKNSIFEGYSFRDFLRIARCRRAPDPADWGAPITVEGKAAYFLGHNRAYVQICYPGGTHAFSAHPYDVLPIERRPAQYRDRETA